VIGHFRQTIQFAAIAAAALSFASSALGAGEAGETHVLLFASHGPGVAIIAWDQKGVPIITELATERLARKIDALSAPRVCLGVFYEATALIGPKRHVTAWSIGSQAGAVRAQLLDIGRVYPTTRPDEELRRLLNEVDLGSASACRRDNHGHLRKIASVSASPR